MWQQLPGRAWRSFRYRSRRFREDVLQAVFYARLAAFRGRRLRDPVDPGVTIITVNWNTLDQLKVLLAALDHFTESPHRVIVVDNGSTDGSVEYLRSRPNVHAIPLKRNWHHGLALDLGVQHSRTSHFVTLDTDAFPIAPHWLRTVMEPLASGFTLAGAHSSGYVHPCFLAMERGRFFEGRHTFAASYNRRLRVRRRGLPKGWDVGKLISLRDPGPHFLIERTSVRGPGELGSVFGDVVYHHFYSSRLEKPLDDVVRKGITRSVSNTAWEEALARYLPQSITSS